MTCRRWWCNDSLIQNVGVSEVGTTEVEEGIAKTHPEKERQLLAVKVFLTRESKERKMMKKRKRLKTE